MKEVTARTGLTDRAVRLYIENGLVTPKCEHSYSGRASFCFCEGDIEALETVASLRRAGFSIADIRRMKDEPESIQSVIESRTASLALEIEEGKRILDLLNGLDGEPIESADELAERLIMTAPSKNIPKEDMGMTNKEIREVLRGRFRTLIALIASVVGLVVLVLHGYKTAFITWDIMTGGGYAEVVISPPSAGFAVFAFLPSALMLVCMISVVLRLVGGKKLWLWIALGACAATILLLQFMPGDVKLKMQTITFIACRNSFLRNIWRNTVAFEYCIYALKYIPLAVAAGFGVWGIRREDHE